MRRGNSRARKNILLLGCCRAVYLNDSEMITCEKFEFLWKRRFMTLMTIYRPTQGLYKKKKKRKSKRRKREQEKGNKLRPYLACIDGLYQWSR